MSKSIAHKVNFSKVIAKYANCWLALSADERRVVASGKHPKEVIRMALAKGEKDPILMWAPRELTAYVV